MIAWKALVPIVGFALLIAGCGVSTPSIQGQTPVITSETSAPASLSPASSAPVATADPATIKKVAAKAYLAIATLYNKTSNTISKTCGNSLTLKQAKACAAKYAKAEYAFYTAVNRLKVPATMLADQKALIRASSAEYILSKSESVAKTLAQYNANVAPLDRAITVAETAANTFRLDLGLPPVPLN